MKLPLRLVHPPGVFHPVTPPTPTLSIGNMGSLQSQSWVPEWIQSFSQGGVVCCELTFPTRARGSAVCKGHPVWPAPRTVWPAAWSMCVWYIFLYMVRILYSALMSLENTLFLFLYVRIIALADTIIYLEVYSRCLVHFYWFPIQHIV